MNKETEQQKAQENADRLRKNKRMLKNLRNDILKDYKEAQKEIKGYTSNGIKFNKGLFNPKSKAIHYKFKVSKQKANKEHKKNSFLNLLHITQENQNNKPLIKTNLLILNKTFYDDDEILKILKEVEKVVLKNEKTNL